MSLAQAYAIKKRGAKCMAHGAEACGECMAKGGEVDRNEHVKGVHKPNHEGTHKDHKYREGESLAGVKNLFEEHEDAKNEHRRVLSEMRSMKGPHGNFAQGGEVEDDDMVSRIMRQRSGEPVADFEANDFDYMDQMPMDHEADYTGANSGDEIGDEALDDENDDVVARAMRSRAKKDRMPRPA